MTSSKWTAPEIRALKGKQPFAVLTAYDYTMARIMDEVGIPVILVGDSLGMTTLGYESTLPVTMDEMLHHTAAVSRAVESAMVIADMPFLSYQVSPSQALANAGRFLQEAEADAVKIEGGALRTATVRMLVDNGIPVLGHIGLLPQSVRAMGGYRVQGKSDEDVERLLADAKALEEAGIFALVLEGMPGPAARRITENVGVPTIGIGAGPHCDAQVLVVNDMLGMTEKPPKFVKQYADLRSVLQQSFRAFREDVEQQNFPGPEHGY